MNSYTFAAANNPQSSALSGLDSFCNTFKDPMTVFLATEEELTILLALVGIDLALATELPSSVFIRAFDISGQQFKTFSAKEFESLYQDWLQRTGRENNMDEYGQLVFIKGKLQQWNSLTHRLLVQES